ncbi:hypothetical protein BBP40_006870 [Aspergillus hancockii]|nr:hypothetical protein BBP40_006870 [Aspergillus hancockii]
MRLYLPVTKLSIEAGSPVDKTTEKDEMLIYLLAKYNDKDTDISALGEPIRLILSVGRTDPDRSMLDQPTRRAASAPLCRSPMNGTTDVLLQDVKDGRTPIVLALQNQRWKMVQIPHALGARIQPKPILIRLLELPFGISQRNVVDMLLDHGALPPAYSVPKLYTLMIRSIRDTKAQGNPYPSFKHMLPRTVTASAEIKVHSPDLDSALTQAAQVPGRLSILQDLVNLGADVFAISDQSFDPILRPAIYGDIDSFNYPLRHAIDDSNPQHGSCYRFDLPQEALDLPHLCLSLQQEGVLDQTNEEGYTLLHLAP